MGNPLAISPPRETPWDRRVGPRPRPGRAGARLLRPGLQLRRPGRAGHDGRADRGGRPGRL